MRDTPRTRPAKPPLSRDAIVAATLVLVDEVGCASVTMRRVAQALDTAPASLYVYVADRRELMQLAHDLAVADLELPNADDGEWRPRLELLVQRTVAALAAHGDIAAVGLTDPALGPHGLRIVEEMLRLLRSGGIADESCAWAVDLLGQFVASTALEDRTGVGTGAWDGLSDEYPTLRELAQLLLGGSPGERARWKLQVLIDGLLAAR